MTRLWTAPNKVENLDCRSRRSFFERAVVVGLRQDRKARSPLPSLPPTGSAEAFRDKANRLNAD